VLSGSYSRYRYDVSQEADSLNAFSLSYDLESSNAALDFSYFPSSKHVVDCGLSSTLYRLAPGDLTSRSDFSQIAPESLENEKGIETALYLGDNFTINSRLLLYLGLRYSIYQFKGPKTVYTYPEGVPKSPTNVQDTLRYENNETIQTYHGPELRASLRYSLNDRSSLKFGYNRMRQYIHMLTNTAAISPTDTWKLSDSNIKPQVGDQVSLGYYRNFKSNSIEASVELFYKEVQDIIEYKGGAQLLLNEQLETDLINGQNRSYGAEFLIRKTRGKLNGWISYTYSRSLNKVNGSNSAETINDGEYFPANYDKPNSLNVIANYKFSRRLSLSSSIVYSTGRPITFPVAKYQIGNSERIYFSDRNEFRIPDYFRVDLSMQIEGNHRVDKPFHSSWAISVYNLLGRDNVYSIYFVAENGEVKGYKLSVFASAIPTITYNFKF
jgi:outer membrane receptor for monomeric catechols